MGYKPLVDSWRDSRVERTDLTPGPRVASMEQDLLADEAGPVDMTPGRGRAGWFDLFAALREPDTTGPEVQA